LLDSVLYFSFPQSTRYGILFPGVACNCPPPDTNGEVGATQYVQIVSEGFQVFNKTTGASVLGPVGITTLWTGFGGPCENAGDGDPVAIYDQLANRWVISQFAGPGVPTDEALRCPQPAMLAAVITAMAFTWARTFSTTRTWVSGPMPTI